MTTVKEREIKAEQIKRGLYKKGVTIKRWAEERGYPVAEVYKVVNGERKGLYGRAHQIAKDLGMWES